MRSMYRFSMVALAVGALALCMAGSAFAAQHEGMKPSLSIGGSVTAGFNALTDESSPAVGTVNSATQYVILSEAIVNFTGKAGPVTAKFRLEANAGKAAAPSAADQIDYRLNNLRNQVEWAVTDAFTLTIAGQSFGFSPGSRPYGNTTVGHFTNINPGVGDNSGLADLVFLVNDQHLTANFKFGAMNAGLALTGDAVLPALSGATEILVLVPYFQGSFGALDVDFYYATGSGKGTGGDPEETEISIAGNFKGQGFSAALQYVMATRTSAAGTDTDVTGINLGARFGGISFHYITKEIGEGADPTVDLALGYVNKIADGAEWFVGYGSRTTPAGATSDETVDSTIMFSVKGSY